MALAMSPPPQVEFLQEPSPTDSDEDLVPNDPANYKPYSPYTTQRKRKNPGQKTSQPASKRQKSSVATQNFTASMSRATNAVAGSSHRSRSPSSWAVAPSNGRASQPSQSGSSAKTKHSRHTMSRPTENASASSRTKLVRRTRDEKRRQRSSSSDSVPEPTPTLRSLVQNGVSLPPASAPAAPKRQIQDFRREELQKRFAQSTQSAPAKHRKKVTTTTTDIIDLTSDGDPPRRPRSTAKSSRNDPDPDIINVTDSDSESQFIKKSAARKAQKQSGAKNSLPNDREVVTVIDSDDEPPRPVVKPEVVTKSEDAAMGPSGSQVPNSLHRPPSPDFEGHGMDLDTNDGVDFGGEDMRDGSPAQSSTLPKTSVFGTHVPPTTPSPPATNENAPLDSMDRLSQSPQRLASPPAVAPTPAIDPCPPSALRGLPAADVSGGDAALPQYGSSETPPLPHTEGAAPKFPSPPQDPNLDLYGMAQSDLRADAPISPDNSTERPMSLFRPNGPLSSHSENPSQDLAPAPAASPSSPLMPFTSTLKPLPRRSFLKGKDIPSHHLSQPSSPYKAIRDVALGTSTLAIQQRLGLQAKGDGNVVPKIDLSTLNVKKKRLSHTPANIPPSLPVDTPQPGPSAEPMAPSISPHAKTQSLRKQSPRSQRDLEAMVDAIITKGQHNAQAYTALSQALPRSRPPSSGSQRVSSTPTLQLEETPSGRDSNAQASSAPSQPSCFAPRRPSSPPFVSPVEQQTPLPLSPRPEEAPPGPPNAETSTVSPQPAFLLPCKPSTPPSVPLVGQQKSSIPILKQEEASFGPSVALINDIDDIIDLTISSDDEKAPRAPPRAPVHAILVPTPIPLTQESKEAVQQRNLKKLKRLMSLHGPTVASTSNSSLGPTTKSPPVTDSISAAMDVDASAVGALPSTLNRENELKDKPEGGLDKHAATDDSHRSPSPSPSPLERGLAMDADSLGGIPPQSEQELVNPEAVDGATTVVESVLAGSSPMDVVEPELVPASKPSDTRLTQVNEQPPSPEVDLPWERRSYDDTEVYHLEYIGPPFPAPPGSESEEVAVENLVALSSPGDSPAPGDMNAARAPDDDSSSSTSDSASRDFLEASDDDEESAFAAFAASPEPSLRRSSRRSSRSLASEPLDFVGLDDEDNFDLNTPISPMSPKEGRLHSGLPSSPISLSDNAMADDLLPTFGIGDETSYPVITWDSFRQNPSDVVPRVRYAKELVSLLHDYINSYDEHFRLSPHMRTVFESVIRENTAEDEPDAPWIDVINNVDAEPTPPWEFYYTNRIWLGDHIDPPDLTKLVGCDCRGKCDPDSTTCSCLKRQNEYLKGYCDPGFSYDNKGRLRTMGPPIFECNALCSCDDEDCRNRVVQHGRKCSVSIQKTTDKGWGVFATKRIPKGTFIGVYSGEFLRDEDSERRGLVYDKSGRTYLLDIDFYYLGGGGECQYVVDAYHAGNFTRFLNNSCDPNCRVIPCYINEPDIKKPLFTLFSKRDIGVNEELCFSYQGYDPDDPDPDDPDGDEGKGKGTNTIKNKCRCGAARCTGFMFG